MSRILKRPMFRKGGSPNKGIMTGLVDRKQYGNGTGINKENLKSNQELFQSILEEATPKTRLPIGEFGLNLASGMTLTDALKSPYARFTKADDARKAAIGGGASKLAIGQALKDPKDNRTLAEKNADALKLTGDERVQYIKDATIKTDAAARAAADREMQGKGIILSKTARDKLNANTSFVKTVRGNLDEVSDLITGDQTLAGFSGSVRRFANKFTTAIEDFGPDLKPFMPKGLENKVYDTDIAKISALEGLIAPAYARVLFPNQRMTNFLVQEAQQKMNLTGLTGSQEVQARLGEIKVQFDKYLDNNQKLLGNQPVLQKDIKKYKIIDGKLVLEN